MGRKAKLTIEVNLESDAVPGMMYTFDDHIEYIAKEISRNPHYFKGIKVVSLQRDTAEVPSEMEVVAGQKKADKCWEGENL